MRTWRGIAVACAVTGSLAVAGCSGNSSAVAGRSPARQVAGGTVGVILPDTKSSSRWETADRPFLQSAFAAAGIDADIQNANGDPQQFLSHADDMMAAGVSVLVIVSLDPDTGTQVIRKATGYGIPVIDYDRLTLGGGAKYYVSFDNVAVGTEMGEAIAKGLQAAGKKTGDVMELDGSPTDNNSFLVKQGYDTAVKRAGYRVVDEQSVPDWDGKQAVGIFQKMFTRAGGRVDAVAAANDSLGGAVVSVLQQNGLAGKVPVTGQDATDAALQRVLLGTQYVTVYKAIKLEADALAKLVIAMMQGDNDAADAMASGAVRDARTSLAVKSVLLRPQAIFKNTVKDVVTDRYTTAARLCTTAALKAACAQAGIS